ncbi:D-3-phosphoglycerate dehydrogenase 2, chloroplastic [Trifolium repens]|nr:D-3-phosphoglycerate dehydrogenase 2, chloroplastic [Trifolium repens]
MVGKTLVVMGFGKVESEVTRRAKGLGMNVAAHDPYAPGDRARAVGVELVSFDQAITFADFISLHMPLTPNALVKALDSGIVAQAALDVLTKEPPAKDSKLVQHENVITTPHLGAKALKHRRILTSSKLLLD